MLMFIVMKQQKVKANKFLFLPGADKKGNPVVGTLSEEKKTKMSVFISERLCKIDCSFQKQDYEKI